MTNQQTRMAVRLIVISRENFVLLLRYGRDADNGSSFWVPPGGAIEPGESHVHAAKRELIEEAGIDTAIGEELWELDFEFDLDGRRVRQFEKYYLVQLDTADIDLRNSSPEPILEHRWWSIDDLARTKEVVYPEGLADRLRAVIAG